jgi:hypothetical protein
MPFLGYIYIGPTSNKLGFQNNPYLAFRLKFEDWSRKLQGEFSWFGLSRFDWKVMPHLAARTYFHVLEWHP